MKSKLLLTSFFAGLLSFLMPSSLISIALADKKLLTSGAETQGYVLSIDTDKDHYAAGENIWVRMRLKNVAQTQAFFLYQSSPELNYQFDVVLPESYKQKTPAERKAPLTLYGKVPPMDPQLEASKASS